MEQSNADTLPNVWKKGLVHRATIPCRNCAGLGKMERMQNELTVLFTCPVCKGSKAVDVGCGGVAERDLNHPTLAYCISEDTFVRPDEVPW